MARWVLRAADLAGHEEVHRVASQTIDVGADPRCTIRLGGRWVDDIHCTFEARGSELYVEDRGSRTGTFLDNAPISGRTLVRSGDRVAVGEWLITAALVEVTSAHRPTRSRRGLLAALALASLALVAMSLHTCTIGHRQLPTTSAERVRALWAIQRLRDSTSPWASTPIDVEPTIALGAPSGAVHVEHAVIPGETMATIAARYRVSLELLARANGLAATSSLRPGQILQVDTVDPPLPRQHYLYQVAEGDRWQDLHARFGLGRRDIEAQNDGHAALSPGATLHLWVDPHIERRRPVTAPPLPALEGSALSVGAPDHGRVEGHFVLPKSQLYRRRSPTYAFGSSHAIAALQAGIARFRKAYAYEGIVVVSDFGQAGGGPLPPHKSHQSGRDVDVWLPALRGAYHEGDLDEFMRTNRKPHPDDVNWLAAWGLVESLLATGEVEVVFLNWKYQDRLYEAAQSMGASAQEMAMIQRQPGDTRPNSGSRAPLRHAESHNGHIHVRFRCGAEERMCTGTVSDGEDP